MEASSKAVEGVGSQIRLLTIQADGLNGSGLQEQIQIAPSF